MSHSLHPEILLALGYTVFLVAAAAILELLARHTHRRAEQYRLVGFKYHRHVDTWECPAGQHLHRSSAHAEHRVARYRAPAYVCNGCSRKASCTDSDQGREVTQTSFAWLET